jgi:hypothetical protein
MLHCDPPSSQIVTAFRDRLSRKGRPKETASICGVGDLAPEAEYAIVAANWWKYFKVTFMFPLTMLGKVVSAAHLSSGLAPGTGVREIPVPLSAQ